MPGYSVAVCAASGLLRSTTLPLSASSGSADGSWPITTLGSVPVLIADTSLAVVSSALAMYWPCTLMPWWVALKCETSQLISICVPEDQKVMATGPFDEEPDEPQAVPARASRTTPAVVAHLR